MNFPILADVLASLNIVVLRQQNDHSFEIVSNLPDWLRQFYPDINDGQTICLLPETFPFLANFLIDAEQFWQTNNLGRLASGLWIQADPSGQEMPLQAFAMRSASHNILLIELSEAAYREQSTLIQKGRENKLAYLAEQKGAEQQLRRSTFYDWLTGLPNQAFLRIRLMQALEGIKRDPTCGFAVLFLDINRFKSINTRFGQSIGDQLLIAVAQRLKQCLSPHDTPARLGEDDFVLILDQIQDITEAQQTAERIQKELSLPFPVTPEEDICITVSIGIVQGTALYEQPEDLIRDACTAMGHANDLGSGRNAIFDQAMHLQVLRRLKLEHDLPKAVRQQELRAYYEPIIALNNTKISGFEVLVRWQHPEQGLLSPLDFIPIAEETGLIVPLGEWILHEACRQTQQWQPLVDYPLTVNVNLSARQLEHPKLLSHIQQILTETGLRPDGLKLEITESMVLHNLDFAIEILNQIKDLGIQLCMDDFGTGYSSLSYLHQLPIDHLKIDRSFIQAMSPDDSEIVQAIITLAHHLGLAVIAEGVETHAQANHLRNLRCEYAQGYLFSKPIAPQAAGQLILHNLAPLSGPSANGST